MKATLAICAASLLAASAHAAQPPSTIAVPTPDARELPSTATSYPYLASLHNLAPFDLDAVGYEEVETLVSGKANVYDWGADGRPVVLSGGNAYTTRILVRRPKDKAKFSGVVLVELMNDARSADWAMMWGYQRDKLVRDGDVWVGVTLPKSTLALKRFDPARYVDVTFAPSRPLGCKTGEAGDTLEEGLRFDMIAQVGALLKSNAAANPLAGYGPRKLFGTEQGQDVNAFAVAFQTRLRLPGGGPIFDGFLIKTQPANLPRAHHCGQPIPNGDPRAALRNIGVPVIAVISPGEVIQTLASRRDDSDDKADPYRRYEVSAGNHLDRYAYAGFPDLADQAKAGVQQGTVDWPFNARCTPEIQLSRNPVMKYVFNSALVNLAAWTRGVAPPRAPRIALTTAANGARTVELDSRGMAVGGLRTVFSDLPTSVDALGSPGPGNCREIGGTFAYSWQYLTSLYGTPEAYAAKALPIVDQMVEGRWLTPADAEALRAEIRAPAKPPTLPAS